ncbi:chemotaxis protein CheA [Anaerocolumna cellulosilytica]|uniref:Chemotaxis protein CheA n=1 Tax=Anaerocolumna cellulosilytica TaxID=433286 RepID=A0A6S6QVE5_9FIRM|nr:chemotaxis protein CheA [Anaerocolumna cellulosilytica]MBB5197009.1 two-component system chemotaxis sensor kinase CheA [Anaerocolumna cellulosilytica]BCJ95223.1 chemotaxis protein CheA [Anaerocolumna cellulosilytica]
MDVSQYLEIFIDETKEHLQSLNQQLLVLETEPENTETINEIFRAAHSLKGMAGTMGYKRMQRLTHDMENVFSEIRNGKMGVTADLVDVLFKGLDALEAYLSNIQESADEGTEDYEDIIKQLNTILNIGLGKETKEVPKAAVVSAEAVVESNSDTVLRYKNLVIADYEKKAINKADEIGMNAFGITVYIQESCILKAARAFLVFKALESLGDVIKSQPEVQDIEDEKFDFDFSVILLTKVSIEKIQSSVLNVSEVKDVVIEKIEADYSEAVEAIQDNHQVAAEVKEKSNTVAAKAPVQQAGTAAKQQPAKPVVNRSVRVDIEKLDVLMNLVSELIIAKNGLVSISSSDKNSSNGSGFNEQIEYLERVTTNLHESVMKVRMVPIESVVNRFPRMIRDLSKKLDKKMELYMTGEETELDRTVIDEIGDPLMHLLRNAADHGLESNEERMNQGKPAVGSIYLDAYQDGNNVVIEVRDDGAGINVEKVKKKAIDKGTITQEQAELMSDKEIIDLLFRPSFSTAEVISDVSGRGVGLDVVKTKIEALGGDIEARTKLGGGSNFIIRLPLTLAIIQALMVELGTEKYAIPLGSIQTIEDVQSSEIKYVHSKEVINLRGTVIPLIRLDKMLDVPETDKQQDNLTVVIVSKGDRLAGIIVDNLIGQQEIVIKSIGKYINNNKIIGGATILGDGEVALILDVNTLV